MDGVGGVLMEGVGRREGCGVMGTGPRESVREGRSVDGVLSS